MTQELQTGRFSFARMESVMLSTGTKWSDLQELVDNPDLERQAKSPKGITLNELSDCCEYLECDPRYILMVTNEPGTGHYGTVRKTPTRAEILAFRTGSVKTEGNEIVPERLKEAMKAEGWASKAMIRFLDHTKSEESVVSQFLKKVSLPEGTTRTIAFLAGTSVEYLTGKADTPDEGSIPARFISERNTFPLKIGAKIGAKDLAGCGISPRMATWLKGGTRLVPEEVGEAIAHECGLPLASIRGREADAADGNVPPARNAKKAPGTQAAGNKPAKKIASAPVPSANAEPAVKAKTRPDAKDSAAAAPVMAGTAVKTPAPEPPAKARTEAAARPARETAAAPQADAGTGKTAKTSAGSRKEVLRSVMKVLKAMSADDLDEIARYVTTLKELKKIEGRLLD